MNLHLLIPPVRWKVWKITKCKYIITFLKDLLKEWEMKIRQTKKNC